MADQDSSSEDKIRQSNFEATTFSYLKRHYFDPERLRQRTMHEFVRAARTGRIIAFTGSMATEDRGYVQWNDFAKRCFEKALHAFKGHRKKSNRADIAALEKIVMIFGAEIAKSDSQLDKRVGFSVIGETLDLAEHYSRIGSVNTNKWIAEQLFLKRPQWPDEKRTIIEALLHDLSIDRVITLNYDFEVELEYANRSKHHNSSDDALTLLGQAEIDQRTQQIIKHLPGARSLISDVFNRERADRLFEFAVGSADHEYHVLHLHGRADAFDSMVVSYRDYDRLYRRSGLSKAPFEHALKLLYAGNPILFVGLGMNEPEVNATLQDFVGDHPYRRVTPTFLLWNSPLDSNGEVDQEACAIKRIDMLHRLGVLTIFDHELGDGLTIAQPVPVDKIERRKHSLDRVRSSVENLAIELAMAHERRTEPVTSWRNMAERVRKPGNLITTWEVEVPEDNRSSQLIAKDCVCDGLTVVLGRSGTGKGHEATLAARTWLKKNPKGTVVLLNADFCFDTDSLLNLLAAFLVSRYSKARQKTIQRVSRNTIFKLRGAFTLKPSTPALIVVSGIERLFGTNGEPLSAEFDDMMRSFMNAHFPEDKASPANVRMLVFGTTRNESYFSGLRKSGQCTRFSLIKWDSKADAYEPSQYLTRVAGRLGTMPDPVARLVLAQKKHPAIELPAYRRAFFAAYLDPRMLEQAGLQAGRGRLGVDILTVMAHIGQPVEADVLYLTPRVQHRLKQLSGQGDPREIFVNALIWLEKHALVIPIKGFRESPIAMRRYGLHATLLSELRERSGVPLSEAVLSTAFNMSLHSAQPTDGPLPEPALHDELGRLIDWLIGAHRDEPLDLSQNRGHGDRRTCPYAIASLRAALATIRGFYSTTVLLSLEPRDARSGAERDGAMTEHAERLERLLLAFQACAPLPNGQPGPFYPDEIVWLHNEIGVVKLAQGSLYDARFAFNEADRINRTYVEFDDQSHNWRRITLNQIVVDIERARLDSAERRIKQIEDGIGSSKKDIIDGLIATPGSIPLSTEEGVSHEEILAIGLINGYRGICAHLAGEAVDAAEYYLKAIEILRRLDERRAYATFQRHYAALARHTLSTDEADAALNLAIAAAESVRQMDLVHHGRIQRASKAAAARSVEELVRANQQLMEALNYADIADMYRVRIEARANLAEARMASGDIEMALEHATDALTVATCHGLSLRKITLRILIGRILVRRGDPQSGRALIASGKEAAGRIGYQRATAVAQNALATEGRI